MAMILGLKQKCHWELLKNHDGRAGIIMWGPVLIADFQYATAEDCHGKRILKGPRFYGNSYQEHKYKKVRLFLVDIKDESMSVVEDYGWHVMQDDTVKPYQYNVAGNILHIDEFTVGKCPPP